jgi:outer membrane protein OmpA-like peptidoglycan-associated protein
MVVHRKAGDIVSIIAHKFNTNIQPLEEGTPLDNVPVFLYRIEDDSSQTLVQTTHTVNGKYTLNLERDKPYAVEIKNYGYSDTTVDVNTFDYLSKDTLKLGVTAITYIPDIELDFNVYYEPGKVNLGLNAQTLLDTTVIYLLNLLPAAIIEIGSHTDNTGPAEFNLKLSQKRADEVVKYLVKKGISEERLQARGYGENFPIAENQFPDSSDNPEGRRKNRRTQIKIIGTLISNEGDEE